MTRKVITRLLMLAVSLLPVLLNAQGSTLYSASSGRWGDPIWATSPDGVASQSNPDDPNQNIVIQNGHTVLLNASEKAMNNLEVESGAFLKVGGSTTRYLEIYGNATLNGTIGNNADGLSFDINGPSCIINGTGTTTLKRLRKDNDPGSATTTNLTLNKDIKLTYASSSSSAIFHGGAPNTNFNVVINNGKKLTVTQSDVSIDGIDGTNSINLSGTFTINGILDIQQGDLWLATDNTAGKDITYEIGKNGKLIVGGKIYGNAGISGSAKAKLRSSGKLELKSSGDIFQGLDPNRNSIIFQSGANLIFNSSSDQNIPHNITYQSVTIRGGGNKILQGATTINGTLYLEGGFVRLGSYDLTISQGGNINGGSSLSFIKTNQSGGLVRKVGSSIISFPVGKSRYNPVRLFNTFSADPDWYTVRVIDKVLDGGSQGSPLTSEVVDRTWLISEALSGGSDLYIQLQWNANEELPGFNRNRCFLSKWSGSEWLAAAPEIASGSGPFKQSLDQVSTLSAFSIRSSILLPIELGYFKADLQQDGVLLRWETLLEENNAFMAIERSIDGKQFQEIGRVKGWGSTYEAHYYDFLDEKPLPGLNYYRLRQVDFDGTAEFHDIISIRWEEKVPQLGVYPTLAIGEVRVHWQHPVKPGTILWLFSSSGQIQRQHPVTPGTTEYRLRTAELPPGHYFISLNPPHGSYKGRFLKTN